MPDNQNIVEEFVIPQRNAAKKFRDLISRGSIRQVSLTTVSGGSLVDLPVKIDLEMAVPKPFLLPIQAMVSVASIFSRLTSINIILEVENKGL